VIIVGVVVGSIGSRAAAFWDKVGIRLIERCLSNWTFILHYHLLILTSISHRRLGQLRLQRHPDFLLTRSQLSIVGVIQHLGFSLISQRLLLSASQGFL
jgi:hypothetical protein